MAFGLDLGNLLVHLKADDSQYNRVLTSAEKRLLTTANKLNSIGRTMTMRVTAPIVAMGAMATKSFASFDDAMTQSLAIMKDATPELRKEMESLALEISKKSITSAKELAKSYFYLASAGLSAEQSIAALSVVEKFAVAGRFDMALATDLVTDAQSALGMTVKDSSQNMLNMSRITDVLVASNTLANASTRQFSEALMRAGPAMKAYGIGLEEGVAVLAAYADQGKKGVESGELFGRMLRLMIKGFVDNRKAWDEFNISIIDADDNMRPLADVIRDLTNYMADMGVTEKAITLDMMGFQARTQQAILPLLGLGDAIENYNEQLTKANGITKEIAEKQLKSFSSQMSILWNKIVAVGISIGKTLSPYILELNAYISKAIGFWDTLNESVQQNVVVYGLAAAAIGPVLIASALLLKTFALMIPVIKGLTLTIVWLTAAALGPVASILLLIAAAYTLRTAWKQNVEAVRNRLEALSNYFKQAYDYVANSVIGKFLKWFKKEFTTFFKEAKEDLVDFAKDVAGTWAGIKALAKGEDFWQAFVAGREKAEQSFKRIKKSAISAFETTSLYIKAFGKASVDHLEDLMSALKVQFGEDADAIIEVVRSKINELQKIPISPHEQLRLQMEEPETRLALVQEEITSIKALTDEETKRVAVLTKMNETVQGMLDALDLEFEMLGKTSEERERAIDLVRFQTELQALLGKEVERTVDEQARFIELMELYDQKLKAIAERQQEINEKRDKTVEGWKAIQNSLDTWMKKSLNWGQRLGDVLENTFDRGADALTDMIMGADVSWRQFARQALADLTRMIIKMQMAQTLSFFGFGAAASVPTAQHGGTVLKTGLAVIHKGEEFTSHDKIGEGALDVHLHNESREKLVISKAESYMSSDQRIIDVTIRAKQFDGPYRRSMRGR